MDTKYIAIQRYCDREDPFWSDCKILGVFQSEAEAEAACEYNMRDFIDDDPDEYRECEHKENELFAIITSSNTAKYSWRIEKI